jgi:hypothetical protein
MEIIEFMKRSRITGGKNGSSEVKKPSQQSKLHNYFNLKIMVSLVNSEFSIEDSEVSVNYHNPGNHF